MIMKSRTLLLENEYNSRQHEHSDILQLFQCRGNILLAQLSIQFVTKYAANLLNIGLQVKTFWSKTF